jgi:ATP-dependent DNA helicase RecQ
MMVGSAMHLLERAGFIHREYAQGSRTYTTRLVDPVKPLEELDIDYERLKTKRERAYEKLRQMVRYADRTGCRHRFILQYFGDDSAPLHCAACDNCLARGHAVARPPTPEETVTLQKVLSCVARMSGRFGRGRVTQTLVGSRSKEVLDAGLDRLSTYGLLADCGSDYIWSLLDVLIAAGCIAVSEGKYPTLSLTPLGDDVMRVRKTLALDYPAPPVPRVPARGKTSGAEELEGDYDDGLFEALKKWRREKAAEIGGVPAYLVYSDRTLRDLARLKPETALDLERVHGIGPAKVQRFGAETLALVKRHIGAE